MIFVFRGQMGQKLRVLGLRTAYHSFAKERGLRVMCVL